MKSDSVNLLLLAGLFFLGMAAHAQGSGVTSTRLEDVVVTGTRTPKSSGEGPVKTDVVTSDDIRQQKFRNAAEALQAVPGVGFLESTGKEGQSALMQGFGGEHVLVLLDGTPVLQNASSGVDLTHIPASDIERIEVVKGGASALYGGQAMGGVINIITKSPTRVLKYEFEIGKDQSTAGAREPGENYSLLKANVRGSLPKTGYKVSLNHRKAKSLERDSSTISRDTPDSNRWNVDVGIEQDLAQAHAVFLDLGYNLEETKSYTAALNPNGTYSPTQNEGDVQRERGKIGYRGNLSQTSTLSAFVLTERTRDDLSMGDDPRTPDPESLKNSEYRRQRFETQWDVSLKENQVTTLGVVAERNELDQSTNTSLGGGQILKTTEVDAKSTSTLEAFVQNDWMLESQEVIAGLRVTQDPSFGSHFDPKVNWSKPIGQLAGLDTKVRASVGTGYRVPNLKERYYILDHRAFAGYVVYGNDSLRPEESISSQVGAELRKNRTFSLDVNTFLHDVRGLIVSVEEPSGTSERVFRFRNMNETRIYGFETGLTWQAGTRLRFSPSFTFTKAQDRNSDLIVPNRPFYQAQATTSYFVGSRESNVSGTARYVGDSYANIENTEVYPSYSVVDARYNHQYDRNIEISFGVKNVFDNKRSARGDSPDPIYDQRPVEGRVFVLNLSVEGGL